LLHIVLGYVWFATHFWNLAIPITRDYPVGWDSLYTVLDARDVKYIVFGSSFRFSCHIINISPDPVPSD
jgi:heme O synthase-like polyprenyltransferase